MALPNPVGLQSEVLYLPEKGHYVVLGTAGSGKTTLAILRAAYLAKADCVHDEKVLLVTFNKALVTYLKHIFKGSLYRVDVVNYHRFARGYLASRNLMGNNDIVPAYSKWYFTKTELIKQAYEKIKAATTDVSTYERPVEVFIEEINWIQKMGITTLDEYEQTERTGRGSTRILRSHRKYFFNVYLEYLELRKSHNRKYDLEDLAYYVREELNIDDTVRMYKHIIIDEGQDFSPTMLQSLSKAIPSDGSITYFGDVAQQIYGSRISWRAAGFKNAKIWRFRQNYRNTKEIANLGLAISKMPFFKEDTDLIEPLFPRASGPMPALIKFENEEKELNYFIEDVKGHSQTQQVAVLVRDRGMVTHVISKLSLAGLRAQELNGDLSRWNTDPGILVGTYHSAKGLEFDTVILPFCNKERLPSEDKILALESREEALSDEIKLIYVGVTRARRGLFISYSGELTELLPTDDGLYQEFEV
ncbi:ATP-dependent helicase [Bacillus subtilis]|uniref:3'-5' exonuclease n=1 Tax=Bacillus subtilis TaxID=1423 RepID=UPI000F09A36E|nr:3'-5' exonuclease [Bacillus subtilis]MCV2517609.1 UvrD-helicase domain-containing protein [Bacillus subtilis]RNA68309.1 ATP-dependent helicase [Bacillus subtilis]